MSNPKALFRNTAVLDRKRKRDTFELRHGTHVELVAEEHDGDTTVLVLRRRPIHADEETQLAAV